MVVIQYEKNSSFKCFIHRDMKLEYIAQISLFHQSHDEKSLKTSLFFIN